MPIPTLEEKLKWLKPAAASEHELKCQRSIKQGKYEIGLQRTNDILEEGMEVFVRSCRSSMGVAGDSVVGIFSAAGDLLNASCGTYLHVVVPSIILKYIIHYHSENPGIEDGDIWFSNDALYGGIHNPDMMVAMPIFYEGKLIGWSVALNHTTETGAKEPGGMPVSATSRFEEGMNFPPLKIGTNFKLRKDMEELFAAFGIRAPQMVVIDLKARCTTADRVRKRIIEMCDKHGADYVTGLFRKMLTTSEQGARKRISTWPDGKYRCVNFADTVGVQEGLIRSCYMTISKEDDRLTVDFTGTSPENLSPYNAHAQAAIAHFSNYIYEYVFHDLPISNATFASIDFIFPDNNCLNPDSRAATSNSVMVCTGLMSASHNCMAKLQYCTGEWRQAGASMANAGNGLVIAGTSQWGAPFADLIAYALNTEGQGGRPVQDGMDAYGFPWCAFGRAPDVELMENEFPIIIPFSQHWSDSCGHGLYRGGVGTAQLWVTHHVPAIYFTCISDNSRLQTPQPLFGGYNPCTVPGISIRKSDIMQRMKDGDPSLQLDLKELLAGRASDGDWIVEFHGRTTRPYDEGDVITVAFSAGGAGYGDALERDPQDVLEDLKRNLISEQACRKIYHVVYDSETNRLDSNATKQDRAEERASRLKRGRPYDEFEQEWLKKRPEEDILHSYGSWPNAEIVNPVIRM